MECAMRAGPLFSSVVMWCRVDSFETDAPPDSPGSPDESPGSPGNPGKSPGHPFLPPLHASARAGRSCTLSGGLPKPAKLIRGEIEEVGLVAVVVDSPAISLSQYVVLSPRQGSLTVHSALPGGICSLLVICPSMSNGNETLKFCV